MAITIALLKKELGRKINVVMKKKKEKHLNELKASQKRIAKTKEVLRQSADFNSAMSGG